MKSMAKNAGTGFAIVSISLIVFSGVLFISGARFNTTTSIPLGLYWITKNPIKQGVYVLFCPPETILFQEALSRGYINSGFCPGGLGYMMKRVLAAKGDIVSINKRGVSVNNRRLKHSTPYLTDELGRALPIQDYHQITLKNSELLLMTDTNKRSFDARYFGFINRSQIKAVISPVLTWKSTY